MTAATIADPYERIAELEDLLRRAEEQLRQTLDSVGVMTEVSYRQGELDTLARLADDAELQAVRL